MKRRTFLSALAALPFVPKLSKAEEPAAEALPELPEMTSGYVQTTWTANPNEGCWYVIDCDETVQILNEPDTMRLLDEANAERAARHPAPESWWRESDDPFAEATA